MARTGPNYSDDEILPESWPYLRRIERDASLEYTMRDALSRYDFKMYRLHLEHQQIQSPFVLRHDRRTKEFESQCENLNLEKVLVGC
jgi:hypothetical protein